jgi:hypothetical protein
MITILINYEKDFLAVFSLDATLKALKSPMFDQDLTNPE